MQGMQVLFSIQGLVKKAEYPPLKVEHDVTKKDAFDKFEIWSFQTKKTLPASGTDIWILKMSP